MSLLAGCHAIAPAFVCRNGDLLLYLAPSAALAFVIHRLSRAHPVFFVFTAAGTLCHELAHYAAGLLCAAGPQGLTIIPHRVGASWQLGSVTLTRLRWYNAAPTALAPLLIVALPFLVARWRTAPGWTFQPFDVAIAFALAPQFLSFWPSAADWRIALRSWPCVLAIAAALALWHWHGTLFQFVKS